MHPPPPFPNPTPPLHNRNQLISNLMRKHRPPTPLSPPLPRRIQYPHHRRPPPLPLPQRDGDLQRYAPAGGAFLRSDPHEGGDGVDCEGEVEGWV